MRRLFILLLVILVLPGCARTFKTSSEHATPIMTPPVAPIHLHSVTLNDDTRVDDYYWLREKGADEVTTYLEAENAYTAAFMEPTEALQKTFYEEMLGRIQETDQSAPYRKGDFEYYHRTEEGKQYRIYSRRDPGKAETEEVLLDMNELAENRPFLGLGVYEVSPDGGYLAFSLDETGFRDYTLQIKELESGEVLPERIEKVKSFAWASDSQTFFYTVDDDTKRSYRVLRHRLGDGGDDPLLYQEDDERFRVAVWRSRSGKYVFRGSFSHTTSEIGFLGADDPTGAWRLVAERKQDHEYDVAHHDDEFLIRTNDNGRNFRIVRTPVATPGPSSWEEVVAHRDDVMVEGLDVFEDFYVLSEREQGLPYIRADHFGGESHRVAMDEPVYSIYPGANAEFSTDEFRFRYESLTTPDSVFDYDVATRERTLVKQVEVLGGYDPANYQSERLWATAKDGTKVPISVVYRNGTPRDGSAPMLLAGYGSYGYPYPTGFSHTRVSLLDRGVTYAIAHIRGGGELGKPWHDQGRMKHKENTFTDFIAVAEHLIANRYTSSERLAIMGGSAGGLLMGAVTNMRPDLFAVVVSLVPFVDVLNTMLDDTLPLTVGEHEEWGDPNEREAYFRMKGYCPYTNIGAHDYPTMLVRTSLNDSQVMYWEPAKYVAKLRAHKTDENPLLFRINMEAGHGGASGRYDYLKETAFDYAFVLTQLGVAD
ncbi:MAG: S9 family peptidase [Deltaproteobacteria bacterium]|nr:S9 family peptidase [Deltaproteobacteria bacterium]